MGTPDGLTHSSLRAVRWLRPKMLERARPLVLARTPRAIPILRSLRAHCKRPRKKTRKGGLFCRKKFAGCAAFSGEESHLPAAQAPMCSCKTLRFVVVRAGLVHGNDNLKPVRFIDLNCRDRDPPFLKHGLFQLFFQVFECPG